MMKSRCFLMRVVFMLAIVSIGFTLSCSNEEPHYALEASYAIEETRVDAYYADADDMAGIAVAESDETEGGKIASGARELEIDDDRFCGVTVILDVESPLEPKGEITINFGNSCVDPNGNVRKGKIRIHFEGRRFRPESYISISFENYQINDIKLNGVRTLTNLAESTVGLPKFQIELANGSAEWDGKMITREHCFVGTWDRNNIIDKNDDELRIDQCLDERRAAEGINRDGVQYEVIIEKELVYKRGCPMAISGIKRFIEVETGKEIVIDYGSGDCDSVITITVNGNIHRVNSGR